MESAVNIIREPTEFVLHAVGIVVSKQSLGDGSDEG